jgi:hypothetical protein
LNLTQAHIFSVFESQGPISIVFNFVEPIALCSFSAGSAFIGSMKEGAFWSVVFTIGQDPCGGDPNNCSLDDFASGLVQQYFSYRLIALKLFQGNPDVQALKPEQSQAKQKRENHPMITLAQPSLVLNSFGIRDLFHTRYSMWRTWNMPFTISARGNCKPGCRASENRF